ncbi:MAG: T9SS type A sorting domain-containing protein [Salinivirgaceae bacterium]
MKTHALLLIALLLYLLPSVNGQISKNGTPYSWLNPQLIQQPEVVRLPGVQAIPTATIVESRLKSGSSVFAHLFPVNKGLWNAGVWTDLPNGDRVWQLSLESDGALGFTVNFSRYLLPEGATVFIFNAERTQVLGAFTSANNKPWQGLAVQPISGNSITIEYYEPADVDFEGELHIAQVGHDFVGVALEKDGRFNTSDTCQVDINCEAGAEWQVHKRAVCRMVINGNELCSGALINNTLNDQTPYVLSANHCVDSKLRAQNTVFVFNYESPTCKGTDGSVSQSISGASLMATKNQDKGYLDFALLRLSQAVPLSYQPYFAGWDSRILTPQSVAGIHHPWGDVKKISVDYDALVTGSFDAWYDPDTFWKVLEWDLGTTEGGSSGSPLFDQHQRIVGSLTGGEATCTHPVNDYYQMLAVAFDKYPADTNQLKKWLVPNNSGVTFLDGFDPLASPGIVTDKISVVHWEQGQNLAFYVANDGGYLAGNNVYGDKEKAEFFNKQEFLPLNVISGARIAFAYASGNDNEWIELKVISESFGFPSNYLGSAYASLGEIKEKADKEWVYFSFDPPIEVIGSVFLSVVLPQNPGDTVALMTVEKASVNTAWEYNADNKWYPYSNPDFSWDISLAHLIALEIGRYTLIEDNVGFKKELVVYPNPANEQVTIETVQEAIKSVVLFDGLGRRVRVGNISIDRNKAQFDVSRLSKGIYVVLVGLENERLSAKIMVE